MFGKMMNSYYYGKSGKGDYNKEDLPKNRWELFWEMLRVRFSGIIRLNLLYVLIWLPAILVMLFSFMNWFNLLGQLAEGALTTEAFSDMQYSLLFYMFIMLIPCIAITGPFTAGVSYVTRNWARDEHSFLWSDFKDALKENWKQAIGISVITSVVPFIAFVCWRFYGQMAATQSMFFLFPQVLTLVIAAIWALGLIFFYPLMVTYRLSFKDIIKNGLALAVGKLPQTLGVRLATLVPAIIAAVVFLFTGLAQWVVLAVLVYYVLMGLGLSRFTDASYTNAIFDRYLNVKIEGAEVGRGLRKESYDDDDDDDEEQDQQNTDTL